MKKTNKKIHLICNAHLDPVWLWEWQEGAAEAMSTFRTAAELCENNQTFIFNHNEAILYKWVQEYEPKLFNRIQKLVKKGRWHIMGGWYLQPDCNMPSGESFIRQIISGRKYFKKHFGVEPTTAINFDPFGHTRGLVQILAKSGYDSYLLGRPERVYLKLPAENIVWVGYDGSEIIAHRFRFPYHSFLGKARKKIEEFISSRPDEESSVLLWGVGNHGGGPSKIDLREVNKLIRKTKDYDIEHSTPELFFEDIRRIKDKLPKHKSDLNPWGVGCYTSAIRIKQKHRLLENDIYTLEKMASIAAVNGLMKYPAQQIHDALNDLMFSQFHDILPGSAVESVEEASLGLIDHGLEIISRLKARAFFALTAGQPKPPKNAIPIMVFNQHPFKIRELVECEFNLADIVPKDKTVQVKVYHRGKLIQSQFEKESSTMDCTWRKRIVFSAELPPGKMNRFDCHIKVINKKPKSFKHTLKIRSGKIIFRTKKLEVAVNTRTGLVDRYRVNGHDYLLGRAFEPIIIADNEDPWGATVDSFRKVIGRFKLMSKKAGSEFSAIKIGTIDSVRIIEDGDVRSIIEAVFAYGSSFISQRYKLPKNSTGMEVETRVQWNEKNKMLKLSIPTSGRNCKYIGQVAYGTNEMPTNGQEVVTQKWSAVISEENTAFVCIDDGIYGSDFSKDGLRLTLLRSPCYSAYPNEDRIFDYQDRCIPRIDQGQRLYRFWFNGGDAKQILATIDRRALVKNEKITALSFFPSGHGTKPKPIALLKDNVVQITTIKQAEKNNDIVIRLFNPTSKKRNAVLTLPFIGKETAIVLRGFEIRTFLINIKTKNIIEADLMEKPLG